MVKRLFVPLLIAIISLVIAVPVLAAYYVDIDVTESNGASYDMLPVTVTMPVDYLVDHQFIRADGRDVRIKNSQGSDVPFMLAEDRVVFASDITGDMVSRFQLTTDNDLIDSFAVCTGDGGYVTITDHDNLELGNDFEIEYEGYMDTATACGSIYPDWISTTESVHNTEVTDHTVTLPGTIIKGDLLILCFGRNGGAQTITWPNGWTEVFQNVAAGEGAGLAYKRADGTEGASVTVQTSASSISAHHVLQIRNYQGTPEFAYTNGEDANPNPPSLTPSWGSKQTLWIAGFGGGQAGVDGVTVTGYPASYGNTDNQRAAKAATYNYAWAASCTRELTAVSENPGTFTMGNVVHWWAWTAAIQGDVDGGFVDKLGAFHIYSSGSNDIKVKLSGATEKTITATGVFLPDKYIVNVWADGLDFGIDINGTPKGDEGVVSMLNNGSNWEISMPYFDYYTHTTSDTLRLTYEPDAIIRGRTYSTGTVTVTNDDATVVGAAGAAWTEGMEGSVFVSADTLQYVVDTVTDATHLELTAVYAGGTLGGQTYNMYPRLPNEKNPGTYDGTIDWVSITEGISVSASGLSTEEAYYIEDIDSGTQDIISPEPAQLISGVNLEKLESNPLHPLVEAIVDGSGGKLTESLVWIGGAWFLFIAAVIGGFIGLKQNLVFTSAIGLGLSILFYAMGIFDYWVIIIFAFGAVAAIIHERMPTW